MAKEIVFITSSFPAGKGEPFLDLECKYLKKYGIKTTFLVKNANTVALVNQMDEEIHLVNRAQPSIQQSILALSNKTVRTELINCLKKYSLKKYKTICKIALASYINACSIKKKLEEILETMGENVILYSYWCDDAAIAIAMLKNHPKVSKTITRVHGWDLYFDIHPTPYLPFRGFIQHSLNYIVPISQKGIEVIQKQWKVPTDNVQVGRLGVYPRDLRNQTKGETFTIVSCSNIIPLKRVDLLAKAIMLLPEKITWYHFGSGVELEKVEKIVEQNSLHDIQFKGQICNHDLMHFYETHKVDVFINVSMTEGIPVSIMEAMSAKIPVIATNVGGTSEIVNDKNGILLSANPSKEELASAINTIRTASEEELTSMEENAYQTWYTNYNAERNFKLFAEEILQLTPKNGK